MHIQYNQDLAWERNNEVNLLSYSKLDGKLHQTCRASWLFVVPEEITPVSDNSSSPMCCCVSSFTPQLISSVASSDSSTLDFLSREVDELCLPIISPTRTCREQKKMEWKVLHSRVVDLEASSSNVCYSSIRRAGGSTDLHRLHLINFSRTINFIKRILTLYLHGVKKKLTKKAHVIGHHSKTFQQFGA